MSMSASPNALPAAAAKGPDSSAGLKYTTTSKLPKPVVGSTALSDRNIVKLVPTTAGSGTA